MEKNLTRVSIGYIDYPSIDNQCAAIIYGSILEVIAPIKRTKNFWDLDNKTVDIEPTSKEAIVEAFENAMYEVDEDDDDCGIVSLEFDGFDEKLIINSYDEQYKWRPK